MKMRQLSRIVILCVIFLILSACGTAGPATTTPPLLSETAPLPIPGVTTPESFPAEPADIIFHNGNIITIEADRPLAQAVAIRGNLIQYVGTDGEAMDFQGPETVLVDLQGATLMPGIIAGHTHILAYPYRREQTIAQAQQVAIRKGYTSVNEMSVDQKMIDDLMQMEREGSLVLRVSGFVPYNEGVLQPDGKSDPVRVWFPANGPIMDTDHHFRIVGVKFFVDGAQTPNRGCWLLSEPYPPAGLASLGCGTPLGDNYWVSQAALDQVVRQAQDAGYRASFHAMGDGAIDFALNAIETALAGRSNDEVRHAIQHNSLIRPDQVEREAALGVVASVRGYLELCDPTSLQAMWDAERTQWYVNRISVANNVEHAFIEDDFGWTMDPLDRFALRNTDPIAQLYGIVTHQVVLDGVVCGPDPVWHPEPVSVERALEMLTIGPAYAVSMEEVVGSLAPGKFADLIILSDDPITIDPELIKDMQVWMTMIDGKVEYCADGKTVYCPAATRVQPTATPGTAVTRTAAPSSQPTAGDIQTAHVKYNCDQRGTSPAHVGSEVFLLTDFGWGTLTREQLEDFRAALVFEIRVNGEKIRSSVDYGQITQSEDGKYFVLPAMFDVGMLPPGEYKIETILTFNKKISDGADDYGPGTATTTFSGTCTVVAE